MKVHRGKLSNVQGQRGKQTRALVVWVSRGSAEAPAVKHSSTDREARDDNTD